MVNVVERIFDSADNPNLQYLITIILIGLISYIIFLFVIGYRVIAWMRRNLCIVGCFL